MSFGETLAQLRHLYKMLLDRKINDQKQAAEGLLAPLIIELEKQYEELLRLEIRNRDLLLNIKLMKEPE